MAKIVYVGVPAHGHTNPMLAVMQELVARGHRVLAYNADYFRAKVEGTGVDFRPYPEPMPSESEMAEAMNEVIHTSVMISKASDYLIPFMLEEMKREKPDVIVYDSIAMWGYVVGRILHIPHICSVTTFVLDGSVGLIGLRAMARLFWSTLPYVPQLMGWRRRMAQRYGKGVAGGITEFGDLNLVFTSQAFHPKNSLVDDRFRFVGPSINPATRDGDFPFDQIGDSKVVYISLGTVNHRDLAFYRATFEAFADYPAQFILSVGKNTNLAALGTIPANFIVRSYVPQLAVLQRADVFITHGGMNSVHEGFYYGVPEVVVPHQFEQLLNGKRVAETGAGILLGDHYPYGKVTARELRAALDRVLHDPAYRQQAERIGQSLKAAGGYQQTVADIESFIGTQHPQPLESVMPIPAS